jgi:hypothetical protein
MAQATPVPYTGPIGPVETRIWLLAGNVSVPEETKAAMKDIERAIYECGLKINQAAKKAGKHDTGRMIHTMDLLRQVKDTADVALQLPHV